jgi:ABC-type nitrate/sulfonate/bicarbonate transport system substrate-binding protein
MTHSIGKPLASSGAALKRRTLLAFGAAPLLALASCASPPRAAPPATLRVKVFPGAQNLALFAGLQQGFFTRKNLTVDLLFTQNSVELRADLARGAVDIVHSAVDNAVAMRETSGHDVVIVIGGDNSMNELFVQSDITAVAQLRGRTLIVDAPNTAYALQAKKILKNQGLRDGDYAVKQVGGTFQRIKAMQADRANTASTLNPPFSLQASASGLRSLGRVVDLIGPYQASGAFVMRPWAAAHGEVLERYLAALIESLRWALDPANREGAIGLLAQRLDLPRPLAEATYAALVDPRYGLARDGAFDEKGFANVLALRAEIEGQWGGVPPQQERFVDLQWYRRALARIG